MSVLGGQQSCGRLCQQSHLNTSGQVSPVPDVFRFFYLFIYLLIFYLLIYLLIFSFCISVSISTLCCPSLQGIRGHN